MNKKYAKWPLFLTLVSVAAVLFLGGAYASEYLYVNSSDQTIAADTQLYAVGAGGTAALASGDLYALTGSGVERISRGETVPEPTKDINSTNGGGGLVSDGESVKVNSPTVLVGLRYYYSPARDTGMTAANLENYQGAGYEFGYYDEARIFHGVSATTETKITMRIISGTGIGVYVTGTDTLLYSVDYTSAKNMLGIKPICDGDAITWFAGYRYYGGFAYAVLGGDKISVINVVDIENYVMGVCAREMSSSWPLEALKAQSIAARTYAARCIMNSVYYYNCGFDLTADTYSQAYFGCSQVGQSIEQAVRATENQFLTYNGTLCDAQYFSSDGGSTEDNLNVNGNSAHPYLTGVVDPYEAAVDDLNSYSSWTYTKTPGELARLVGLTDVVAVSAEYSKTENVIALTFLSATGQSAQLTRGSCRTTMGLPSIHYSVSMDTDGNYVFTGGGWGHNLGMSQFGAYAMAAHFGKTYKDILGFYYTGVGLSYGEY